MAHPKWKIKENDAAVAANLSEQSNISPTLSRVLAGRGFTDDAGVKAYMSPQLCHIPSPDKMLNADVADARIAKAIMGGERVLTSADFDSDGANSCATVVRAVKMFGGEIDWAVPHRIEDGYCLNDGIVRKAHAAGVTVLITVDNGITSVKQAILCKELGIDLIVTDHHLPQGPLPEAYCIVNPQQPDCEYPHKDLAGVGVAYIVMAATRKALRE